MDIYIVDTNLIFSAALNINSGIGKFILRSDDFNVSLYAPNYLKAEISRHHDKLVRLSKVEKEDVDIVLDQLFKKITFIDDNIIPFEEYVKALRIVRDIDPNDVSFVALSNYIDEFIWTGDMQLYHGLIAKGFNKVVTFEYIKRKYRI